MRAVTLPASHPLAAGRFWWSVLLVGFTVRLALALGTDIYFDEAYYWTWSKHLAASYFDHPPLIAWAIALLGIRGTSLLAGLGTTALIFLFARDLHRDPQSGVRAAALWSVLPAGVLAGFLATPDSLLLLFWAATLWALWRKQWLVAGVLAGLAFLSKYNAVLLGPIVLLVCLRERRFPKGLWLTLLAALLVGAPVILWNAAHDWVGFEFQLKHGLGGRGGFASLGEFLGGQFAMAGPVLLVLAVIYAVRGERDQALLRTAIWVPLVFFGIAAFRTRGEANWAAMAYVAACVGLVNRDGKALKAAGVTGALICVLGAVHLLFAPIELKRDVPLRRVQGWSELAQLKDRKVEAIYAPSYQLASEAAYYAHLPADVLASYRKSQYDVWPPLELAPGTNALWLSEGQAPPPELLKQYEFIRGPEHLQGTFRGRVLHDFHVWTLSIRR